MLAIVREVPRSIARGERTHVGQEAIDLEKARAEHRYYVEALSALGCEILPLEEEPALADSVFVEDTACIVDELAVLTRPGAPSRRPEVDAIAPVLENYRSVVRIEAPATLDGGDILVFEKRVFVGLSSRSDEAGVAALAEHLAPHGYAVEGVALRDCLHLKSAVSVLGKDRLLVQPAWVDPHVFGAREIIPIDPDETFAANAVRVADAVILPEAFPRTRARLESRGLRVVSVPAGELAKAEGGVTCCSLLLKSD
jgi:dimethylargininase